MNIWLPVSTIKKIERIKSRNETVTDFVVDSIIELVNKASREHEINKKT